MKSSIKLPTLQTIKIKPKKPFNFDATFHKPDHFTSGDNFWEPGVRWQTRNFQMTPLGLKFINRGTIENPLIEIKVYSKKNATVSVY